MEREGQTKRERTRQINRKSVVMGGGTKISRVKEKERKEDSSLGR